MAGDIFRKVQSGDPLRIEAATWNALLDSRKESLLGGQPAQQRPGVARNPDIVYIKNDSGVDVGRYGILSVTGVEFAPGDDLDAFKTSSLLFSGDAPTAGDTYPVVAIEPIAYQKIGRAVLTGWVQAQINITDTNHEYAELTTDDVDKFVSTEDPGGIRIIYQPGGTGTQWCVVELQLSGWDGVEIDNETLNSPTSIDLSYASATSIKVELFYTPYTFSTNAAGDVIKITAGEPTSMSDVLIGTDCLSSPSVSPSTSISMSGSSSEFDCGVCDDCTPAWISVDFGGAEIQIISSCDDTNISGINSRKLISATLSNVTLQQCVDDNPCHYSYVGGGSSTVRLYAGDNCAGSYDEYTLDQVTKIILVDATPANKVQVKLGVSFAMVGGTDIGQAWFCVNYKTSGGVSGVDGCDSLSATLTATSDATPHGWNCDGTLGASTQPSGWWTNVSPQTCTITGHSCE